MEFRQEIRFEPGYDHRLENKGCHGMNIRFLLHGSKATIQFLIFTGWLPNQKHVEGRSANLFPMAADIGYHADSPPYEGCCKMECDIRDAGHCYYDGSSLAAEDLFLKFTTNGTEVVWNTLQEYYALHFENE